MRVLVAHPGQQHSFKVASALKTNGLLYQYITCVYDKKDSFIMRCAHAIVRGDDTHKLRKRLNPDLEDSDVTIYFTFLSLLVIILSRFKGTKKASLWLDRKIADAFGLKVAKYAIRHEVNAVLCFSMNETVCFEYLKHRAPNIKRIVDCANSPVSYMKHIYDEDIMRGGLNMLKCEAPSFWDEAELDKQMRGINATQYFVAPSFFVKKGLLFCGVPDDRIKVVHYGCNFTPLSDYKHEIPEDVLTFVYVGQVTYRKGMHYLLKAFSEIKREDIRLNVVGGWKPDSKILEAYKSDKRIKFWGNILHDKVKDVLLNSDVFLFSSLSEGFSLSCLEALSCGLPLVCSNNSGANDVIKNGINGYTFDYYDTDKLKDIIIHLATNKQEIVSMRREALATANNNNWSQHATNLVKTLQEIL